MAIFNKRNEENAKTTEKVNPVVFKVNEITQKTKAANELKKNEKITLVNELNQRVIDLTDGVITGTCDNYSEEIDNYAKRFINGSLYQFSKSFFEKMILPGKIKLENHFVSMYPYIFEKRIKTITNEIEGYRKTDTPLFYIKDEKNKEILLTNKGLFFYFPLEDNSKNIAKGEIPCSRINTIAIERISEACFQVSCNKHLVAELTVKDVVNDGQEMEALGIFLKNIEAGNYIVSDADISNCIKNKLGLDSYRNIECNIDGSRGEKILFYSKGIGSDIAVTDKRFIIIKGNMTAQYMFSDYEAVIINQDTDVNALISNVAEVGDKVNRFSGNKKKSSSKGKSVSGADKKMQTIVLAASLVTSILPIDELATYLVKQTKKCQLLAEGVNHQLSLGYVSVIDAEQIICIFKENKKLEEKALIEDKEKTGALMQIKELAQMKETGIITKEEFEEQKKKLLATL